MSKTFRDYNNRTAASWWRDPSLRKNVLCASISYWGAFSLGYDGSYMNGLQSLETWNEFFDHPSGNRLGIISAISYLPSLALLPTYSLACDYLGRRWANWIGCSVLLLGALIGTFATEDHADGMLMGGRALVGVGGSLILLSTNLLCNEILHPRLRAVGAAFFLVFYYVGSIVSAWCTFGVIATGMGGSWSWRLPTLLQIVGPSVVFVGTIFIPESPRWLLSRGKVEQAHKLLADHHANGDLNDELVLHELEEIQEALAREKREKVGFMSFFKTKGNRHRLFIVTTVATGSQGNGVAVFSYYLTPVLKLAGVTSALQQTGINGGLQIWNLILAGLGASMAERLGRRKVWLMGTGGMAVCYIVLIGLSGGFANTQDTSIGLASVGFMFLCFGFYDLCWTPLAFSYTTEANPALLHAGVRDGLLRWKYYFIFLGALIILFIAIYFTFVETKGLSLEEIFLLFDHNEGQTLADKKEAVDAHMKLSNKATEVRHLEVASEEKDSDLVV
ncbi:hypothetical protein JCM10213v2_001669 [Rhodosporidiobolus nylandii]